MGIIGVMGVISVICIIGIIIKKVARQMSDNLICESLDKMWDFKACKPEKPQKIGHSNEHPISI